MSSILDLLEAVALAEADKKPEIQRELIVEQLKLYRRANDAKVVGEFALGLVKMSLFMLLNASDYSPEEFMKQVEKEAAMACIFAAAFPRGK